MVCSARPRHLGGALAGALAVVLAASSAGAALAAPAPSIEARLKRIDDLEKINTLIQGYFYLFDARDFRAYVQLFTEDGEITCCGGGTFKGRETIFQMLTKTAPDLGPGAAHSGSELMIDLKGDTATSRSRWIVFGKAPDGRPGVIERGHYDDVIVRGKDGQWRFKSRRVTNELRSPR